MECLINLMALCIFDPSNVYITADIEQSRIRRDSSVAAYPGATLYEGAWCYTRFCRGPIGTLKLGVTMPLSREWTMEYGFKHRSFILEPDQGSESFYVSATWRTFRAR